VFVGISSRFPDENISLTQGSWAELLHAECDAMDPNGRRRDRLDCGAAAAQIKGITTTPDVECISAWRQS
jgi:hypothetical protein